MNKEQLYSAHNPDNIKINIGGSCVGGIGSTNWDMTYNEIRILPDKPLNSWHFIQESINRKKQFTVNIDQYISRTSHWLPDEATYKNHVNHICNELLKRDSNVINYCDITVDNEPLKNNYHPNTDSYIKYVKWCSQVAKSYLFKVSAGNEEFNLAEHRVIVNGWKNLYYEMGLLKELGIIDRIAIHIQGACLTDELRKRWTQFCFGIVNAYKFKLENTFICTEAAYTDPKNTMYSHWIPKIKMALDLKCSAIGFVFIDYDSKYNEYNTDYSWLAIFKDKQLRVSQQAWNDFRDIAIKYKRIEIEEFDDMKLKVLKPGSKGNQVLFIQEIMSQEYGFENPLFDGIYGSLTLHQVKEYQSSNHLTVDGIIGKFTMTDLINKSSDPKKWMNRLQVFMAYE